MPASAPSRRCPPPRRLSYIDAELPDGTTIKLARLRYIGSAHDLRFAIYRAGHNGYAESLHPPGLPFGTCEDALDLACNLYLQQPHHPEFTSHRHRHHQGACACAIRGFPAPGSNLVRILFRGLAFGDLTARTIRRYGQNRRPSFTPPRSGPCRQFSLRPVGSRAKDCRIRCLTEP